MAFTFEDILAETRSSPDGSASVFEDPLDQLKLVELETQSSSGELSFETAPSNHKEGDSKTTSADVSTDGDSAIEHLQHEMQSIIPEGRRLSIFQQVIAAEDVNKKQKSESNEASSSAALIKLMSTLEDNQGADFDENWSQSSVEHLTATLE